MTSAIGIVLLFIALIVCFCAAAWQLLLGADGRPYGWVRRLSRKFHL